VYWRTELGRSWRWVSVVVRALCQAEEGRGNSTQAVSRGDDKNSRGIGRADLERVLNCLTCVICLKGKPGGCARS